MPVSVVGEEEQGGFGVGARGGKDEEGGSGQDCRVIQTGSGDQRKN